MSTIFSGDYSNKKDFAEALKKACLFYRFKIDGRGGEGNIHECEEGRWSTDRKSRGENAVLNMYTRIADTFAELRFNDFKQGSGRFIVDEEELAGKNESYYSFWQERDGKKYYIFTQLGSAAKYEQVWDWAEKMEMDIKLYWLAEGEELPESEAAEPETEDGFEDIDYNKPYWRDAEGLRPEDRGHNYSIAVKNGVNSFYDEDSKSFVTLECDDDPEQRFDSVALLEMLFTPAQEELEPVNLGFKYKLSEDGKWGFINSDFSQIISPRFEDFHFSRHYPDSREMTFWAWEKLPDEEDHLRKSQIDIWFYNISCIEGEHAELSSAREKLALWMTKYGETLNMSWVDENWDIIEPEENAVFLEDDGMMLYSYNDSEDGDLFLRHEGEDGVELLRQYCSIHSGVLSHNGSKIAYPYGVWSVYVLFITYSHQSDDDPSWFENLKSLFYGFFCGGSCGLNAVLYYDNKDEHYSVPNLKPLTPYIYSDIYLISIKDEENDVLRNIKRNTFIVCRMGAKGLIRIDVDLDYKKANVDYLLPCEYDCINKVDDYVYIVSHFGKKGVCKFDNNESKGMTYIVPCDYESISYIYSPTKSILVKRMGFEGIIDLDGNWIQTLHK